LTGRALSAEHDRSVERTDPRDAPAAVDPDAGARRPQSPLAEGQALLDAVLAASFDGICILDPAGVFLEVNAAFERITGIPRDRWIGRSIEEMQQLPGVPKQSATLEALRRGRPATTLVNARGGELVMITASPHCGPDGTVRNVILNARNITQLNLLKYQLERERGAAKLADLARLRRSWFESRLDNVGLGHLVVASPQMGDLLSTAAAIADVDSTVLLEGETGTGKGLVARFIHHVSRRRDRPLVEVDCGAIPENLVESELFGYEPGAFTGSARGGKKGQFEVADGGTIFLDEIGELPLPSQTKLLKVLDDKEVRPLGAAKQRHLDLRVICATNKNLRDLVAAGRFREDLLYRIDVVPLRLPPLRERPEDKKALIYSLLDRFNKEFGRKRVLSLEAVAALCGYDYPGNVRELRNILERLVLTSKNEEIGVEDLPPQVQAMASGPAAAAAREAIVEESLAEVVDYRARVEKLELQMLRHFARTCRSTYEVARATGLTQSAVVRKLKKYGLQLTAPHGADRGLSQPSK
jgi:PAS domain S-box-containing protein